MKYLDVAKWEFLEKVKSKAFIISLVLMPLIMVGFGVLPGLLVSKPDETSSVVGIYDETGGILQALSTRIEEKYKLPDGRPNYVIRNLHTEGVFGDVKVKAPPVTAQQER